MLLCCKLLGGSLLLGGIEVSAVLRKEYWQAIPLSTVLIYPKLISACRDMYMSLLVPGISNLMRDVPCYVRARFHQRRFFFTPWSIDSIEHGTSQIEIVIEHDDTSISYFDAALQQAIWR